MEKQEKRKLIRRLVIVTLTGLVVAIGLAFWEYEEALRFEGSPVEDRIMIYPDGDTIRYRAFEHRYYVSNVEDSAYQYLNIYIPESAYSDDREKIPILMRTYAGGYMAAQARQPSEFDATGRALREGFVVVIPGTRGWNSQVTNEKGDTVFTGRAPAPLLDLKAAVRYLRHNNRLMPGSADRIIIDGTSAGGALAALLGATGNHPVFEESLKEMGAARGDDDIFGVISFCPITDLDNADMAYEWLYECTNGKSRVLTEEERVVSEELAAAYPAYLNSLDLKTEEGTPLTADNYKEYLTRLLIGSAQRARDAGMDIPEETGVQLNSSNGGEGQFVLTLDLDQYLNCLAANTPLKTPPAFDKLGVTADQPTFENLLFGDNRGTAANFTNYSLRKATGNPHAVLDKQTEDRVIMMNPMYFIPEKHSKKPDYWYIRHGAADRDTGFEVPVNLAALLRNKGFDVNFDLAWNRPHTGDYNLDEVFEWIDVITEKDKRKKGGLKVSVGDKSILNN